MVSVIPVVAKSSNVGGWMVPARGSSAIRSPASRMVTGMPRRTRLSAAVRPTGPAPAIRTGREEGALWGGGIGWGRVQTLAHRSGRMDQAVKLTKAQEPWIGARGRIGVIIPSTNIGVEYDCQRIIPPGVTWHFGRFFVAQPDLSSDNMFLAFIDAIRKTIPN